MANTRPDTEIVYLAQGQLQRRHGDKVVQNTTNSFPLGCQTMSFFQRHKYLVTH